MVETDETDGYYAQDGDAQHLSDPVIELNGERVTGPGPKDKGEVPASANTNDILGFPKRTVHTAVITTSVVFTGVATALPETPSAQLAAGVLYTLGSGGLLFEIGRAAHAIYNWGSDVREFGRQRKKSSTGR